MNTLITGRRSSQGDEVHPVYISHISNAIRQSLFLQNRTGTRSAVERMKALNVPEA